MTIKNITKILLFSLLTCFFLQSCNGKLPGGDARKFPADPEKRVQQNLNERGGTFDFASSNELWRASLDVIDFMPLSSVNYSGGIIITDWYSAEQNSNESIKVSIRFLTNEIRSDALDIKVFNRKCVKSLIDCKIINSDGVLVTELKKEILKKATLYKKEDKDKK